MEHLEFDAMAQAADGIEKHRKGEAILEFCLPNGSPAAGIPVRVSQRSHDFLFGVPLRPHQYRQERTLQYVKGVFNFVQLLEFNWGQYEPDEGKPLVEERRRFIHEWCIPHGIRRFYGHMLVWTRQYGEYPKTALPLWLFRYPPSRQYELLKARVQREMRDYRDVNMMWDVVNEPVHCRAWGNWNKPNRYDDEPLDVVYRYVADALRWAHEANPNAPLLVNEYDLFVDQKMQKRFARLLEMLLEKKIPLHAVGIQAHDMQATYWPSPEEVWQACETFGTKLRLPVYFTELCYDSSPNQQIQGKYRRGVWNPQNQADAVEEFYRVAFGYPMVEGIVYFGLVGSEAWIEHIGLLDEQGNPKPAWERVRYLITEEWKTQVSGKTAEDGTLRLRGFGGQYQVEATYRGRRYTYDLHLQKGAQNRWQLTLSREHQ